jgi:hypothetical protein
MIYLVGQEVKGFTTEGRPVSGKIIEVDAQDKRYLVEYISGPLDGATQYFSFADLDRHHHGLEDPI